MEACRGCRYKMLLKAWKLPETARVLSWALEKLQKTRERKLWELIFHIFFDDPIYTSKLHLRQIFYEKWHTSSQVSFENLTIFFSSTQAIKICHRKFIVENLLLSVWAGNVYSLNQGL